MWFLCIQKKRIQDFYGTGSCHWIGDDDCTLDLRFLYCVFIMLCYNSESLVTKKCLNEIWFG